jgi:hypothetical protein
MYGIHDSRAARHPSGRLEAIIVRGSPRGPARVVAETRALQRIGLEHDRLDQLGEAKLSTREITLI